MAESFDRYRGTYEEEVARSIGFIGQDHDFFTRAKVDHLLGLLREDGLDPARVRALDVGCGAGVTDRHLRERIGELHGVDVSPGMVETARQANPGVRYLAFDGVTLPYAEGEFDLVFVICVLHHVPPPAWPAFVRELARVTRPGGRVAILEHNPWNPLTRRAVKGCVFDRDAVLLSMRTARGLLQGAALEIATRRYILFFPFGGGLFRRIERWLAWLPMGAQYCVSARKRAAQ